MRREFVRFARRPRVRQVFWGANARPRHPGHGHRSPCGGGSPAARSRYPFATSWLKAAIEDNFGGNRTVSVGGTQIERDEQGRTSLRLRDIVVRDADGTVVASAPKAEVGISGASLFAGKVRAQSLNLVGAEMAVRIETDGKDHGICRRRQAAAGERVAAGASPAACGAQ